MCVKFAVRSHKYLFERKRFSYKTFFKKYDRSINGTIILKNLATLLPIEQDISSFLFVVTNIWGTNIWLKMWNQPSSDDTIISLFCWIQIIQWWISGLSLHFSFSQIFYGFCWGRFFAICRTLGKNHNKWLSWYTHEYNWYHNIKLHCSGVVFVVIKDSSFLQ